MDTLPGLHGDEAWVGLLGYSYKSHEVKTIFGMNHYTGVLQPLIAFLSFSLFGTGVAQLRFFGVLFNVIGIALMTKMLFNYNRYIPIIFLMLLGQSSIYLVFPRIAWEVNTFTMLMVALSICILGKIISSHLANRLGWIIIFLIINFVGTYNHVIFASFSLSALLGLIAWQKFNKSTDYSQILPVLIVNLINCFIFILTAKYFSELFDVKFLWISIPIALLAILSEGFILRKFLEQNFKVAFKIPRPVLLIFVIFGVPLFFYYHGLALIDVFSNYKVFSSIYSYRPSNAFKLVLTITGIFFGISSLYFILKDLVTKSKGSIPAFIITAHIITFNLFTTNNSIRYYLILFILIFGYLSIKIFKSRIKNFILLIILISFSINAFIIIQIFSIGPKSYIVNRVMIGNKQIETSGHFLPKKNLVDSLSKHNIGNIEYASDRYFIEQPILFYKLISPWSEDPNKSAYLDYRGEKGGFIIFIKK
ncbi:hypothetical protein [Pedobacter sp. UBA5917]|uniref:hypothetical protein n=1 Tax=Pedobacter sp. UBA5917 TaxID=1947061 RepID=UPI0025D7AA6A|nr:hypothetical protein [Pedobacter sp. UBA5917]